MKNISVKKYAIALYELVKEEEKDKISEILKSFIRVVIKNKDVNKMDKIIKAYSDYYNEKKNKMEITVITAEEIQNQLASIQTKLKDNFGKDIEIKSEINPDIIGGIILKYGDNVADGSIKRKVAMLAETLK